MSLPYYPMYPRDFFEGTQRMSLELKGAYIMLLNLIYTRNGPVDDEDGYLARYVGCSIRKWQKLRLELVGLGKIVVADGMIRNSRADEELLKRTSYVDQKRENRARPNKIKDEESQPRTTRAKPETEPQPDKTEDDANASSRVKPHFIPADWKPSEELMAWAVNEFRTPNNETLTEAEIRNEADSFVDYWTGRRDTKAKRPGWDATFRARIREQAAKIIRARPRAYGAAGANASARANGASQFAPKVSQHDAFALAAIEAGVARGRSARRQDDDPALGPVIGYSGPEVVDFADARGAGARRAAGDRSDDGPSLFALPVAAVR